MQRPIEFRGLISNYRNNTIEEPKRRVYWELTGIEDDGLWCYIWYSWWHYCLRSTLWQYTWLTDKNWVKVFEGDIMSYWTINKWVVTYNVNNWCYEIIREFEDPKLITLINKEYHYVIWNKLENHELLSE